MKRSKKNYFPIQLARVSALLFVGISYLIATDDIKVLLRDYPIVINFIFGSLILGLVVATWNNTKMAGISFILTALAFFVLNWSTILIVNVIFSAVWLFLIGVLFLVGPISFTKRRKPVKKLRTQYAHQVSIKNDDLRSKEHRI